MQSDIHKRNGVITSSILKSEKKFVSKAAHKALEKKRGNIRKDYEEKELSGNKIFR